MDIKENWMPLALAALLGTSGGGGMSTLLSTPVDLAPIEAKLTSIQIQLAVMGFMRAKRSVAYWEDFMQQNGKTLPELSAEQQRLYHSAIAEMGSQNEVLETLGVILGDQ